MQLSGKSQANPQYAVREKGSKQTRKQKKPQQHQVRQHTSISQVLGRLREEDHIKASSVSLSQTNGWECGSRLEYLPGRQEAQGSITRNAALTCLPLCLLHSQYSNCLLPSPCGSLTLPQGLCTYPPFYQSFTFTVHLLS